MNFETDSFVQTYWCGEKRCKRVVTIIYTVEKKIVKRFFNDLKEDEFYE